MLLLFRFDYCFFSLGVNPKVSVCMQTQLRHRYFFEYLSLISLDVYLWYKVIRVLLEHS